MKTNENKILTWIVFLPIIAVIVTSFFLTNVFLNSRYENHKQEILNIQNKYVQNLKEKIKERIEHISLFVSTTKTKKEAITFIESLKYEDNGYIFILDKNYKTLFHKNKSLIDVNIKDIKDIKTQENIKKIVDLGLKRGSTFIEYIQSENLFENFEQSQKISYIKYIPSLEMIVGTGLYTNDLNNQISEINSRMHEKMDQDIKKILIISILITLLIIALLLFLTNKLKLILKKYSQEIEDTNKELVDTNNQLEHRVEKQLAQIRQKDIALNQQSKLAAIGEMLGNIAHQWRQPLSAISTTASGIKLKLEYDTMDNSELDKELSNIVSTTITLSNTIDDFRNLYSIQKEKTTFSIKSTIQKVVNLVNANLKNNHIHVIEELQDIKIQSYENELIQVILNIINNSKDALSNKDYKKYIIIKTYQHKDFTVIDIFDNGGGIKDDIISRVFEPYFTTKFKSQGTGIGLYMTKNIIEKSLQGQIECQNIEFEKNDTPFKGAQFKIYLNKSF